MGKAIATVLPAGTNSLLLRSSCDRHSDDISCLAGFWHLCKRIIRHLQGSDTGELLSDPDSAYHLINHKDHNAPPPYNNQHCMVDVIEIENPMVRGWIGEEEDEIKKAVLVETERQPPRPPPAGPPSAKSKSKSKSKSKKRASLGPYSGQEHKILLVGEEERPPPSLGPYNLEQRILLVGDGDFSFSASLALAFGDASNIIATSLDSYEFLILNYSKATDNIRELTSRSCKVIHGVDATKMARHPELRSHEFDRIIYNFPHAGFANRGDTREAQIKTHQKLVTKFLKNARRMIKEDGQIHITHKCTGFFLEWNITLLGRRIGLRFVEESPFDLGLYPGYATKFGFGGDANFNCFPAKTYKFNLPTPKPNKK